MEDLGYDSNNYQVWDDRVPPPPFPPVGLFLPAQPTDTEMYCIGKMREISERLKVSPYHLTRQIESVDIVRYSDRSRKAAVTSQSLTQAINKAINGKAVDAGSDSSRLETTGSRYIPAELLDSRPLGARPRASAVGKGGRGTKRTIEDVALQRLEQAEMNPGNRDRSASIIGPGTGAEGAQRGENEGSDVEGEPEEPDEFEMDDDYGVDHYASDDGGDDKDDDEAVY
jgi:hypothetical protein